RAVGSIAGALLGSQIGDGSGQLIAIAAGTLAGYWAGGKFSDHMNQRDRAGLATTTREAISTGRTSTWRNPDTGVRARVSVSEMGVGDGGRGVDTSRPSLDSIPQVEMINSYYQPTVNLNVRGGPGTDYRILYTLKAGEPVPVIGRVAGSPWFLVADEGRASGFAHGSYLEFRDDESAGNALRDSIVNDREVKRYVVDASNCRRVTQEVTLSDGSTDSNAFRICRQSDGNWVEA
ncbi:MAG: glycine zipper 2TM domain-containing protein, partial [Proteobacteria bacterium]